MEECLVKLGKSYYDKGFFNIPIIFTSYLPDEDKGKINIKYKNILIENLSWTRTANKNRTPRITPKNDLRDLFHNHTKLNCYIVLNFISKDTIEIKFRDNIQ